MTRKLAYAQHIIIARLWAVLPVAVKGAVYRKHRANVVRRGSVLIIR